MFLANNPIALTTEVTGVTSYAMTVFVAPTGACLTRL